jgi:hypothetical protein
MKPFWFGCVAGAAPWVAITYNLAAAEEVPGFVIGIFVSLFLFFNSFALNQWLQYRQVGPWRSYAFGEKDLPRAQPRGEVGLWPGRSSPARWRIAPSHAGSNVPVRGQHKGPRLSTHGRMRDTAPGSAHAAPRTFPVPRAAALLAASSRSPTYKQASAKSSGTVPGRSGWGRAGRQGIAPLAGGPSGGCPGLSSRL